MALPMPADVAPFQRPRDIARRELVRCQRPGCYAVLAERLPSGALEIPGLSVSYRDGSIDMTCPTCGEVRQWRR